LRRRRDISHRRHQDPQRPHPGGIEHRPDRPGPGGSQDIGRISPDRARAAIRQLHHQVQHAGETPERRRRQQLPEQRMPLSGHPHRTRQHPAKMLQSVAITEEIGKTHLLIGLGLAACEQGRRVRYVTTAAMVNELSEAADNRQLSRVVARYGRLDLLLLDELGYVQLDPRGAELLFQIITEREERASIAIATNLPFSEWGTVISDPRLVAAIVDRITFNACILETGTQSYRLATSRTSSRRARAG
jgi:hypothetical protein